MCKCSPGNSNITFWGNVGREDREAGYRENMVGGIREGREEKVGGDKITLQSLVFCYLQTRAAGRKLRIKGQELGM